MILTIVYLVLGVVFTSLSYMAVPRYGCNDVICVEPYSNGLMPFWFFVLALFFSLLAFKRAVANFKLDQVNQYNSKDLGSVDF
ncbi:MAG: hypothetical protein ABJK64_14680 [Paraglaciecola sp.]|uniref:hypothetical protein n=1 Tax=Paraglaciecola sp. TaxID=1920173 RepID=UPI0032986A47